MTIDWSMGARLFIAPVRGNRTSEEPDLVADLLTCVRMARAWPPDVVFTLHTDSPVLGKTIFDREGLKTLPGLEGDLSSI